MKFVLYALVSMGAGLVAWTMVNKNDVKLGKLREAGF